MEDWQPSPSLGAIPAGGQLCLETISFLPSGMDEPVMLLTDIIETMPAEFGSEALG